MNSANPENTAPVRSTTHLSERIPLTVKMLMVTIAIGISLWALLDYTQSSKLKKIFYIQLFGKLSEQSMEDRLYIDRYIRSHQVLAELIVTQSDFDNYVNSQNWSTEENIRIKFHKNAPPWFLRPSLLRILASPRYSILLDPSGKVREIYVRRNNTPPSELLHPSNLMIIKSHKQSFITKIDGNPYLIASESSLDNNGKLKATLMFASPIDEELLIASKGPFIPGRLVALVTFGKNPKILISSNEAELRSGTYLDALKDRFLITGQHIYDYGSAEYIVKLVSFISMKEVDALTKTVISTGRHQRNIIAPVFILSFAFLMMLVTRRITRLNIRMSDFSQQTLGTKKEKIQRGDQLHILEKRFHRLTEEVIDAREMLKKQADEKTRLIINNAFDAIITLDAGSKIITWNPQAEFIFGWSYMQVIGKTVTDIIISPVNFESISNSIQTFLDGGKGTVFNKQIQITASHRDGHEFPAELAISPARSEGKYFFVVIIRDISERKLSENKIKNSLREKEVLLKEIHHRVKNNMQVISSLLNLQSRNIEDSKYAELFNESKNRINSMALVHHKLYQSNDLANIDFGDYIQNLSDNLFMFYGISPHLVTLKVDVKDIILSIDTAIPCGLIINELVSNALKYAFPEEKKGELLISLKRNKADNVNDTMYELIVSDNGIGIPEDFDISKADTLGLQLVVNLTEHQLQGKLEVDRANGTGFHIRFKELTYKKRI